MKIRHAKNPSCACLLLLLMYATATSAQPAPDLPADLVATSMARLPYLSRNDMDEQGQAVYDVLPGRSRDRVLRGPLAFAAYNPAVAKSLFDLHNAAVGAGTLDPYTEELAILVACRETNYSLEWNAHEELALKAGLSASLIDVVRNRQDLAGVDEKDAAVIRFGRQMFGDKKVDSDTFAKVSELFSPRGLIDMVAVMNTYAVSGFFAIAVDQHLPAGQPMLK